MVEVTVALVPTAVAVMGILAEYLAEVRASSYTRHATEAAILRWLRRSHGHVVDGEHPVPHRRQAELDRLHHQRDHHTVQLVQRAAAAGLDHGDSATGPSVDTVTTPKLSRKLWP
jgi:hypothetical protein